MDSITSPLHHAPGSWSNNLRAALATSRAAYTLRCMFDVGAANALLSLDCVPADDKRQLKAFVRTSTRDTSTGLQAAVSNYDFSKRCKAAGRGRLYPKGHPGMATLPSSIATPSLESTTLTWPSVTASRTCCCSWPSTMVGCATISATT